MMYKTGVNHALLWKNIKKIAIFESDIAIFYIQCLKQTLRVY